MTNFTFFDNRVDDFARHLENRAKELCPDYPWKNADAFDCLWALTSSLEGITAANNDCHKMIDVLRIKLGMTKEEVVELWQKELHAMRETGKTVEKP